MTSFFVVPGLLLANGEACLLIPFVPGLDNAEKFALFCESVISAVFSQSLILLCKMESLSLRFLWLFSSSFFCWSWRTRLLALERGMHHCKGQWDGRSFYEKDPRLKPITFTNCYECLQNGGYLVYYFFKVGNSSEPTDNSEGGSLWFSATMHTPKFVGEGAILGEKYYPKIKQKSLGAPPYPTSKMTKGNLWHQTSRWVAITGPRWSNHLLWGLRDVVKAPILKFDVIGQ